MRYRPLGNSGLVVSVVGIGTNAFGARADENAVRSIVDTAIEEGVTLFDTADTYTGGQSETLLGKALSGKRDQVVVATKFGMPNPLLAGPRQQAWGSRSYVRKAVEGSLGRLGTDWIDLFQLHRPDPVTPVEETLGALSELVTEGKIRYFGNSNFTAWQVVDAHWTAASAGLPGFVTAQNEYSLYNRAAERELLPAAEHVGVSVLPYFPLAYGFLSGKYAQGQPPPEGSNLADPAKSGRLTTVDWGRIDALHKYAADRGLSILDVAIGGLAARPAIGSVIAGVTKPEQVKANAAAGQWEPTAEDLAALDALDTGLLPGQSYITFARR